MTFVSHAQNFEDLILWRALKHVGSGFYIDIGAQDPSSDSVSLAFHERGWKGVHVEPVNYYADKLRAERPGDRIIEAVVGDRVGGAVFYEIPGTGLSTADQAMAEKHERAGFPKALARSVPSISLSAILDECAGLDVHWLKIDVEGMERDVLESWRSSTVRPWIVVIESTKPNSPEPTHAEWEPLIVSRGYAFVYFDGLNRFYLSREHSGLGRFFGHGPNLFDDFVLTNDHYLCRRANEERTKLSEEVAKLGGKVEALSAEMNRLKDELSRVYGSKSWKVTAPMRRLSGWVRRAAQSSSPEGG